MWSRSDASNGHGTPSCSTQVLCLLRRARKTHSSALVPRPPCRARSLAPPAAARGLDAYAVAALQVPRALARQGFFGAVGPNTHVAPHPTVPAATDAPWGAFTAFGLDGEHAVGEHFDLSNQPFAAGVLAPPA